MPPHRRDDAFSLVETIVSISLIVLTIGLISAGISRARKTAITIKCAGNLHTISVGLNNFIADKGHYPGMRVTTRPTTWHHALEPYVTGGAIPASNAPASLWAQCPGRTQDETGPFGYVYNQYFGNIPPNASDFDEDSPFAPYWHLRPSQVVAPGKKIVIGDGRDDGVVSSFSRNALRVSSNVNDVLYPRRHNGGGHYLYADGHIAILTPAEFVRLIAIGKADFLIPF